MPRVLIIDDQKGVRTMIAMVLGVNHFEVEEAFAEGSFDAAIVDIFLGDTSGVDVIATLRRRSPSLRYPG